jgi:hypothetical protein
MRWSIFLLMAGLGFADGTTPKPNPADYDVHAYAGPFDIGAEYMVHSFSAGEAMYLAEHYLVVEVAFYPPLKDDVVTIDLAKFKLRLNHRTALSADPPSQAAASLRPSMFDYQQPRLSGGIGAGPIGVGMGQPGPVPGSPMPRQPRTPEAAPPGGIERTPVSPEEVLLNTALPAGSHKGPVSGFVYFRFEGKLKSVKNVELIYDSTTLKLK